MVSRTLSSPIPIDPAAWATSSQFYERDSSTYAPRGRVRPEAKDIARRHQDGTLARLFNPEPPTRSVKFKPLAKDHMKDNVKRMREIQARCKQRQEETSKPVKPPYRSDKYDHVPARVAVHTTRPVVPGLQLQTQSLQADGGSSPPMAPRMAYHRPSSASRASQPNKENGHSHLAAFKRPSSAPASADKQKNYVVANIRHTAGNHKIRRSPSMERLNVLEVKQAAEYAGYKRGVVPQYLLDRQDEWRHLEEKRIASLPDPSIPPGHALMPKAERLSTLEILETKHTELTRQLQSLPIRCDTLRVQNRRTELENNLTEIDDAIKIFSRPKVFVKLH